MSVLRGEPVETLQRIPMSWEDYLATPESPRHEWVDGICVVSPLASWPHQEICFQVTKLIHDSLPGVRAVAGANVRLPRNRVRIPDVVVIDHAQRPGLFVEAAPVIVAEILSPSTRVEDTIRKSREYAEGGIGQFWVVDPELRRIDVFINADGEWDLVLHLDDATPAGDVVVGEYGVVPLDLAILDTDA